MSKFAAVTPSTLSKLLVHAVPGGQIDTVLRFSINRLFLLIVNLLIEFIKIIGFHPFLNN